MEKLQIILEELESLSNEKRLVASELAEISKDLAEWNVGFSHGLYVAKEMIIEILENK